MREERVKEKKKKKIDKRHAGLFVMYTSETERCQSLSSDIEQPLISDEAYKSCC